MPPTVTVAAFVFGIVLLLAAIIGKEIKIVAVELPALTGKTRGIVGAIGIILMGIGLLDLLPAPPPTPPASLQTATAIAVLTPTASASGAFASGALFVSDFDQDRGDWSTGPESNARGAVTRLISDGKYRWEIQATDQGGYQMALPKSAPALANFELQADVRQLSGDTFYGLIFRNTGTDGYYLFLLHGRDYALYRIDQRGQTTPLSQADHPAIKPNSANVLKVVADGPTIRLYINGVLVGEVANADPAGGTAGLYVNAPGNSRATYEFDNFRLSSSPGKN
jgi:3-keto-disaccharide hydrolase